MSRRKNLGRGQLFLWGGGLPLPCIVVHRQSRSTHGCRKYTTRLQYALVDRAIALGWPQSQVIVIAEDLGRSGSTAEGRRGFQRLVAEVELDHVGLVLGIEISRLARSSRDRYQLLEVCAVFSTRIADADGLYDPTTYNDRLLLGLKGTMSEAERHTLKQRLLEGKRAKARRGELALRRPMGYIRHPAGEVMKDPGEQARGVIETVLDDSEQMSVEVQWAGGHRTRARLTRPVARPEQLSYYPQLLARVISLYGEGLACTAIACQGLHAGSPKQRLRIKAFFGTSENAVKTQVWIAISACVLVALVKKRLAVMGSC